MVFGSQSIKKVLARSTALVCVTVLASQTAARAANIVINGPTATTQVLNSGDNLTVTNTGSITASPGVSANNTVPGFINNSGLIKGSGTTDIAVHSGANISAGITSSGTISGGKTGISVDATSKITGGISDSGLIAGGTVGINNTGTISAADGAIVVRNGGKISGGFSNSGLIKGGYSSGGIVVGTNSTISGGISNSGTIEGGHIGILVVNSALTGGINSSGLINGVNGWGIFVGTNSTVAGGITNSGTISGARTGIIVETRSTVSGGITNRGLIKGGSKGISVSSNSTLSGGISNSGTISGGGTGILVDATSKVTGGIFDSGLISGGTTGINNAGTISGAGAALAVKSGGQISGGISNQAGGMITGRTGILVSNSKISGGITNAGTIDGTGGTAINLQNLTGPTPININGGQIIGNVTDNSPGASFSPVTIGGNFATDGNFNVSSLAINAGKSLTISAGNSVALNTMPPSAGGTLAFGVNGATAGSFGTIDVTNAALNMTGLTIKAAVGASPALAAGEQMEIGQGDAPIIGGPGGAKTPIGSNSTVFDFEIANGTAATGGFNADDLFLFVSANPAFIASMVPSLNSAASGMTNAHLVSAGFLNQTLFAARQAASDFTETLVSSPLSEEPLSDIGNPAAVEPRAGGPAGGANIQSLSAQDAGGFGDLSSIAPLGAPLGGGPSAQQSLSAQDAGGFGDLSSIAPRAGNAPPQPTRYAAYVYGSIGTQNEIEAQNGTTGLLFHAAPGLVVGAGVSGGGASTTTFLNGNSRVNALGASVLVSYTPAPDGLRIFGAVTMDELDADIGRHYLNGATIDASDGRSSGYAYGGAVRAGYTIGNRDGREAFWFMPYGEMDVSHAHLDGYTEIGGSAPATFGDQNGTRTVSRLGEEVFDAAIPEVELRGRLAWVHAFGESGGFSANVTGLSTTVPFNGGKLDWAETGMTALYKPAPATTLAADLGANIGRSDEPAMTGTVGLSVGF